MLRTTILSSLAWLAWLASAALFAQEKAPVTEPTAVELIKQLGSEDPKIRKQAIDWISNPDIVPFDIYDNLNEVLSKVVFLND